MTLRELYNYVAGNPLPLALFFMVLPLAAWIMGLIAHGSRNITSWGIAHAVLVYLACLPGIFATTLNIYLFLFERQSVWEASLVLQVLPIVSMVLTLVLIKSKIPFKLIPGFGRLSGFLTLIAALMGIMWLADRLHVIAFAYIPFSALLIGFVLTLLLIRFAWSRLF
jgi:hypothetical protein